VAAARILIEQITHQDCGGLQIDYDVRDVWHEIECGGGGGERGIGGAAQAH
jgi:hypothetical protein